MSVRLERASDPARRRLRGAASVTVEVHGGQEHLVLRDHKGVVAESFAVTGSST